MQALLRPALVIFLGLSALTGAVYPMIVTGVARLAFEEEAAGSLVRQDGKVVGSDLIGQNFGDPRHFVGRPSATAPMPDNAAASGGSNLGPTNPALLDAVKARIDWLHAADPGNTALIPVDLVTASASGLDPDLSIAAARYQAPRIARLRRMPLQSVNALIDALARRPWLGFLGEPRVNVLRLNLALDAAPG